MIPYQTKSKKLSGTNLGETYRAALNYYKGIVRITKRKPYVRSAYFHKEKIFFDFFWDHLRQKSPKERFKRLKFFKAAVELIKYSKNKPVSKPNPNKNEIYHRFAGLTSDKELFYVQIKEVKRGGRKPKYFMSCFPPE